VFAWLPDRIEQAKIISQEFEQDWKFILNPPATEAAIQACEVALGVPLPPSYRDFLLRWNGASLFRWERYQKNGFCFVTREIGIQGTDELLEFNQENRLDFTDEEWDSLILFCYIPGTGGDFCGFDPHQTTNWEYAVLDCCHEVAPLEWRQARIASSFAEWLEKIFDQVDQRKDPEFWLGDTELGSEDLL